MFSSTVNVSFWLNRDFTLVHIYILVYNGLFILFAVAFQLLNSSYSKYTVLFQWTNLKYILQADLFAISFY